MANEKICKNCGARNQPYAAFCANCGESFIPAVRAPPVPPEEPSSDQEWGAYTELKEISPPSPAEEPSRRFKKRYIIYAVLVLLLLSAAAAAISMSRQTANTATTSPPGQVSVAAATATPRASASAAATLAPSASPTTQPTSPTAQPAASTLPDYTSRLNTAGLSAGLVTVSPFERVTINGQEAYVGTLAQGGKTYTAQVFPMNSYLDALAFRNQLISAYTSQGYTEYAPGNAVNSGLNLWYGLYGHTLVGVSAMSTSQIDAPITLVMTTTI
jgi:hypothetical protein